MTEREQRRNTQTVLALKSLYFASMKVACDLMRLDLQKGKSNG